MDVSPLSERLSRMRPAYDGAAGFERIGCPVAARIVVLEERGTPLVVVALDSLGINEAAADALREHVSSERGIPPGSLLLCASHLHSAVREMVSVMTTSAGWEGRAPRALVAHVGFCEH